MAMVQTGAYMVSSRKILRTNAQSWNLAKTQSTLEQNANSLAANNGLEPVGRELAPLIHD